MAADLAPLGLQRGIDGDLQPCRHGMPLLAQHGGVLVGQRGHDALTRQMRREEHARGGAAQAHHRAVPHVHVHGRRRFLDAHDGGPPVAPDSDRHRVADLVRQVAQQRRRKPNRVELLQADQTQLQGQRPEPVAAAAFVLRDQAELAEAHEVRVGLGRRHAGVAREVFQGHRPARVRERQQQLPADLHALDAALLALGRFIGGRRDGIGAGLAGRHRATRFRRFYVNEWIRH